MTDRPVSDFLLSATLHGVVIGFILLMGYAANQQVRNMPQILELVAGEGDNFGATVAPALGTPGGIKIDLPVPPAPKVEPVPLVKAAEPAPTPPIKAAPPPVPVAAPKAAPAPVKAAEPPPAPNYAQQIRRNLIRAESQAKLDAARERRAEAKRAQAEAKRMQDEKNRMTKAEFDKMNKTKSAKPAGAPPKVARIDAEGIAKGVIGGSTENKTGGAGGRALVSNNDNLLAAYFALFKQRLKLAFEAPDGLSDTLEVVVRVQSNADGSLTNPRVVKASGSPEFDRAVVAAIRRVTMPARPDGRSEPIDIPFSMRERDL
jgi:colicin import membrane protein